MPSPLHQKVSVNTPQQNEEHALLVRANEAYNEGVALQRAGKMLNAVEAWKNAVTLAPQQAASWVNLCLGLTLLDQTDTALTAYTNALTFHPTHRDLLYNHANLLYRTGRTEQAQKAFDALLQSFPDDAAGLINAGKAAKQAMNYDKAEQLYRRAMTLCDERLRTIAQFNLANLLLLQGRWAEGFEAYEARLALPDSAPTPWGLPAFHDQLPRGSRVLLWNDQGAGDAIMFARFIPLLVAKGYRLFLFVQTPLKPLLTLLPDIENVFCPSDAVEPMDAALPLCSLPFLLKQDPTHCWRGPYLTATAAVLPPTPKPKIGLVWAGRATHENDSNRSISLSALRPLFDLQNVDWFSLQLGDAAAQRKNLALQDRIVDMSPCLTDFSATANILAQLDLLITVDTAAAHLAGAMGQKVWTLIPATDSDWRWGEQGDTTFWYPSMSLFRQTKAGAWDDVVARLAQKIQSGH